MRSTGSGKWSFNSQWDRDFKDFRVFYVERQSEVSEVSGQIIIAFARRVNIYPKGKLQVSGGRTGAFQGGGFVIKSC